MGCGSINFGYVNDDILQFIRDASLQKKAAEAMKYILDNFATDDAQALQALETWGKQ